MKKSVRFFNRYKKFFGKYKNIFIILGIIFFIIFLAADIYLYFYFTPRCSNFKGDANGDRRIDESDIEHLNNYFSGGELNCKKNADVNEDGRIDIYDGEALLNYFSRSGKFSPSSSGGTGTSEGSSASSGDGGEVDKGAGAFAFWKDFFSKFFAPKDKQQEPDKPSDIKNQPDDEQPADNTQSPGTETGDSAQTTSSPEPQQNPYENTQPQLPISCSNNPFLACNGAELSCSSGVRCDCYQECSDSARWCWGSANSASNTFKIYACQSSCAVSGSYAPSSHDCCDGLSYVNGQCLSPLGIVKPSCSNNPSGCDGAELSCDIGTACDCDTECISNTCSADGKCISQPVVDYSSPVPSPTSSSSPISFSTEEKPFYQRLLGWVSKTITGWFTSE
mgnify:CR=1 FL=1